MLLLLCLFVFLTCSTGRSQRYILESRFTPLCASQHRSWGSKDVALTLHSERGPLHHSFVTRTMTEFQRDAGGRMCNQLAAGLQSFQQGGSTQLVHLHQAITAVQVLTLQHIRPLLPPPSLQSKRHHLQKKKNTFYTTIAAHISFYSGFYQAALISISTSWNFPLPQ